MTILGHHTISETKDLIQDYEWRIDALNKALGSVRVTLLTADPALIDDWDAFLSRWTTAKYKAKAMMLLAATEHAGVPDSINPSEDIYQSVLNAGSPTQPLYTPKDLPGLALRIQKVIPVTFPPRPSSVAWDFDLAAYKATDTGAKVIQQTGQAAAQAAKGAVVDSALSHPGYYVAGAVGLVGAVWLARKLHFLP